jgi:hypothetical protein
VLQRCHDTHCPDRDLHSVEAIGHYVCARVTDEAASCDEPIELRDIIERRHTESRTELLVRV